MWCKGNCGTVIRELRWEYTGTLLAISSVTLWRIAPHE
jgi:hypothetical protein